MQELIKKAALCVVCNMEQSGVASTDMVEYAEALSILAEAHQAIDADGDEMFDAFEEASEAHVLLDSFGTPDEDEDGTPLGLVDRITHCMTSPFGCIAIEINHDPAESAESAS